MGEHTQFLNVDLDVVGQFDLDPLVKALEVRGVFCLHHGQQEEKWRASFELAGGAESPATTIEKLVYAVRRLDPAARGLWNGADERTFDLGIEAGAEPHAYHAALDTQVLRAIAEVGARLVITVYGTRKRSSLTRDP